MVRGMGWKGKSLNSYMMRLMGWRGQQYKVIDALKISYSRLSSPHLPAPSARSPSPSPHSA